MMTSLWIQEWDMNQIDQKQCYFKDLQEQVKLQVQK